MDSLRGHILISSGGLFDPNFRHTVVLIGEHGPEGALGVVLNRPSKIGVQQALPPLAPLVAPGTPVYRGGPVQPGNAILLAELLDPSLADLHIFGSIGFLTGDLPSEIEASIRRARIYMGYAGWGAGQLEAELAEGSWIVDPAHPDDVFGDDPESLWNRVLLRKGPDYAFMASMPFDLRMN